MAKKCSWEEKRTSTGNNFRLEYVRLSLTIVLKCINPLPLHGQFLNHTRAGQVRTHAPSNPLIDGKMQDEKSRSLLSCSPVSRYRPIKLVKQQDQVNCADSAFVMFEIVDQAHGATSLYGHILNFMRSIPREWTF